MGTPVGRAGLTNLDEGQAVAAAARLSGQTRMARVHAPAFVFREFLSERQSSPHPPVPAKCQEFNPGLPRRDPDGKK